MENSGIEAHSLVDQGDDGVRDVDRRNGNAARARRQAAASAGTVEGADGSVHRLTSTTLVIPEDKRCEALTVKGNRCRAGRMRGLTVCVFHSHRALTDEGLAEIVDERAKPRLTPRKALQAVVAMRSEELAEAAVANALDSQGLAGTRAVLALVDAVDPLVSEGRSLTLTREGMASATYEQMAQVFGQDEAPS